MCDLVFFPNKDVDTAGELKRELGVSSLPRHPLHEVDPEDDCCLCAVDIPEALRRAGRTYTEDGGWYTVEPLTPDTKEVTDGPQDRV